MKEKKEVGSRNNRRLGSRKIARRIPKRLIHVQASFNNTIVTVTDVRGRVVYWASAGTYGFMGYKKRDTICCSNCSGKCYSCSSGERRAVGLEKGLTTVEGIEAVSSLGVRGEGLSARKRPPNQRGGLCLLFRVRDDSLFVITALKMFSRIKEDGALSSALWLFAYAKESELIRTKTYLKSNATSNTKAPSSSDNSTLITTSTTGVSSAILSASLVASSLMTDSSIESSLLSQATTLQSYTTASGPSTSIPQPCSHVFMPSPQDIVFTTKPFEYEAFVTSISDSKTVPSFEELRTSSPYLSVTDPLPLATNEDSQELWDCLRGLDPFDSVLGSFLYDNSKSLTVKERNERARARERLNGMNRLSLRALSQRKSRGIQDVEPAIEEDNSHLGQWKSIDLENKEESSIPLNASRENPLFILFHQQMWQTVVLSSFTYTNKIYAKVKASK
uniref:Ribosomal protein S11, plastidic n=1 Tax=Tanacetum cinerariifolium TaxID=118510 RepID=A0A6L2MNE0_TANCI|nr:ribosomal protein S11, plastidic [Tanacetum cinerariifolium]